MEDVVCILFHSTTIRKIMNSSIPQLQLTVNCKRLRYEETNVAWTEIEEWIKDSRRGLFQEERRSYPARILLNATTTNQKFSPIDRTLLSSTTSGQTGPGSDGNERVFCIPPKLRHCWNLSIKLLGVIYLDTHWRSLTHLLRCSRCILQPLPNGAQYSRWGCLTHLQRFSRCIVQAQPTGPKSKGVLNHGTVSRWMKKFCLGSNNFDNQVILCRTISVDSEAVPLVNLTNSISHANSASHCLMWFELCFILPKLCKIYDSPVQRYLED